MQQLIQQGIAADSALTAGAFRSVTDSSETRIISRTVQNEQGTYRLLMYNFKNGDPCRFFIEKTVDGLARSYRISVGGEVMAWEERDPLTEAQRKVWQRDVDTWLKHFQE